MADERKAKMIEMFNNGSTYAEIGIAFNISKQRVFQILNPKVEVVPKSRFERLEARYKENCNQMVEQAKQKIAREIFEDIRREIDAALKSNYSARRKRNEERRWSRINDAFLDTVNGKIDALRGIEGFIDELEAKYTEEATP